MLEYLEIENNLTPSYAWKKIFENTQIKMNP